MRSSFNALTLYCKTMHWNVRKNVCFNVLELMGVTEKALAAAHYICMNSTNHNYTSTCRRQTIRLSLLFLTL